MVSFKDGFVGNIFLYVRKGYWAIKGIQDHKKRFIYGDLFALRCKVVINS